MWNTNQKQIHRFEVFHQRCLRRILRVKCFNRMSNEEVLERARINPVARYISANRLRWFGHVVRMPDTRLPRYLLDWTTAHGKDHVGVQEKPGYNVSRRMQHFSQEIQASCLMRSESWQETVNIGER